MEYRSTAASLSELLLLHANTAAPQVFSHVEYA